MLEDGGAVHEPISQEPGTGFQPANSVMLRVLTPALAWRDQAEHAAGSLAKGAGSWVDSGANGEAGLRAGHGAVFPGSTVILTTATTDRQPYRRQR
jgi:hypothetical protein